MDGNTRLISPPNDLKYNIMKAKKVWFDSENMYVQLNSGHIIGNPIAWFGRLAKATPEQRMIFEIDSFGESLHWEELEGVELLQIQFDFHYFMSAKFEYPPSSPPRKKV